MRPGIAVYGVEPAAGDDWVQSLARNERVTIPVPDTIADGLQTQSPGRLTFPIVQALCAGVVTVTDAELCDAMRFAFERLKLVIEPSGAARARRCRSTAASTFAASASASRSAAATSIRRRSRACIA